MVLNDTENEEYYLPYNNTSTATSAFRSFPDNTDESNDCSETSGNNYCNKFASRRILKACKVPYISKLCVNGTKNESFTQG